MLFAEFFKCNLGWVIFCALFIICFRWKVTTFPQEEGTWRKHVMAKIISGLSRWLK